jgi:hypothetical protein
MFLQLGCALFPESSFRLFNIPSFSAQKPDLPTDFSQKAVFIPQTKLKNSTNIGVRLPNSTPRIPLLAFKGNTMKS